MSDPLASLSNQAIEIEEVEESAKNTAVGAADKSTG
jgi:hypothetical protein